MKIYRLFIAVLFLAFHVPCTWANEIIDELKSSYVTRYDLGIHKLHIASDNWARTYREYPELTISMSINKSEGIDLTIFGSLQLRKVKSKGSLEKECERVGQHYLAMILGNFGNPAENNIHGNNIYYSSWGGYFSSSKDSPLEIEKIGKAVSLNSKVTVLTGNSLFEECILFSGEKYSR